MDTPIAEVVILAGRRGGTDPVAAAAGVAHKAMAPVAGTPMLERVAAALRGALPGIRLTVAMTPPQDATEHAVIERLRQGGPLELLAPAGSPCGTVAAALAQADAARPLLIATADHALLTADMVRAFVAGIPPGSNVAVAVATRDTIAAVYPDTRRTYWRFADRHVSGCNLFLLAGPEAARVVEFWGALERDRKRPWAMIRRLGPLPLVLFALGRLTLDRALAHLGRRIGARLAVVELPFAEAAMDVDRPGDLAIAERILKARPPC